VLSFLIISLDDSGLLFMILVFLEAILFHDFLLRHTVMNIKWDYSYYQPWSDNEWLVDEMIAMQDEILMQDKDITMQ